MSALATSAPAPAAGPGTASSGPRRAGSASAADLRAARLERAGDRATRLFAVLVFLFLFAPIGVVILLSFNAGRSVSQLTGFSLQWYAEAWTDRFVLDALGNSLTIASVSAVLATILGTASALAMGALPRRLRGALELLTYVAIIVPGIVIGIATLIFVVTAFDWLNPWLAFLGTDARLGLGTGSVIAAHALFTLALVNVIVRTRLRTMDRSLVEASEDLYATPVRTFVQVTLPQLAPAILSGALLAFTFSFDDFIIAFFTAGQDQTIPIYLFASIRRGVTPQVNAIASVLLGVTLVTMLLVGWLTRRRSGRARPAVA